jgi:hypothetical protein
MRGFESVRPLGWAVFLDSGDPARTTGRYDVIAAEPLSTRVVMPGEDAFAAARSPGAESRPGLARGGLAHRRRRDRLFRLRAGTFRVEAPGPEGGDHAAAAGSGDRPLCLDRS